MPPKRSAAGAGRGNSRGGKKAKTEEPAASTARQMVDVLKKSGDDRKKTRKVDAQCSLASQSGCRVRLAAANSRCFKFRFVHSCVLLFWNFWKP